MEINHDPGTVTNDAVCRQRSAEMLTEIVSGRWSTAENSKDMEQEMEG